MRSSPQDTATERFVDARASLRRIGLVVLTLTVACGAPPPARRATESWSFTPFGTFKDWSVSQGDTGRFELRAGTVRLRFSERSTRDTSIFAVLSGVRIGLPGEDQTRDLAPGEGTIIRQPGARDSVFFQVGGASFRGTATDVFMSGVFTMTSWDTTIRVFPPEEGATWRMGLISRDTLSQ